nr:flagellar motor switch protein FliM [Ameyamaea chiangmaiensis]
MQSEPMDRILNQDEIDSLLGTHDFPLADYQHSGMEKIIGAGFVSHERLPMLEIVFDRWLRMLTTSLRNFTNDNVEMTTDGMRSLRFSEYVNSVEPTAVFAVFKAEEWENYGLMVVDPALVYTIVDVLMGGQRGSTAASHSHARPFTMIERGLVERLVKLALADFSASFGPICAVNFRFERLEVNARFAAISRGSNAAVLTRMHVDMDGRGGDIDLLLPYATLEPVRDLLLQQFMGEKFGQDSIWETHLARELWNTQVELEVVLDEQTLPLVDLMQLKPGQKIALRQGVDAVVHLRCGSKRLFTGRVGRRKDRVAVRVEDDMIRNTDDDTEVPMLRAYS